MVPYSPLISRNSLVNKAVASSLNQSARNDKQALTVEAGCKHTELPSDRMSQKNQMCVCVCNLKFKEQKDVAHLCRLHSSCAAPQRQSGCSSAGRQCTILIRSLTGLLQSHTRWCMALLTGPAALNMWCLQSLVNYESHTKKSSNGIKVVKRKHFKFSMLMLLALQYSTCYSTLLCETMAGRNIEWVSGGFLNPSITVGGKFNFQPGRRDMRERRNFQVWSYAAFTRHDSGTLAQDQSALHIEESRHVAKVPVPVSGKLRVHSPLQLHEPGNWRRACPECCSSCPLNHGSIQHGARESPSTSQGCSSERQVKSDHWSV